MDNTITKLNDFFYSNKELALSYIHSFIGKWYRWGGNNPIGFDCSGLAIEYLKSGGLLPRSQSWDTTAQGLWDMFNKKLVSTPYRGCLVFWHAPDKPRIIHVEIMINSNLSIGASGGGSTTLTEADAIRQNAYIKQRSPFERKNIAGYIDPWLK